MTSCCPTDEHDHGTKGRPDWLLYGSLAIIVPSILLHLFGAPLFADFTAAITMLLKTMWWGIALGIIAVGFMNKVPREYFSVLMGRGDTVGGLLRAAFAGLLLDLCSHGVLMIGVKLYERGASLAQVITFLIASPWNSFSLTLILIALVGLKWTLAFIAGSVVVALATGAAYLFFTKRGVLPANPHAVTLPDNFDVVADAKIRLKTFRLAPSFLPSILLDGARESVMVIRWLFFGTILAALIRVFVSTDTMTTYFGPTLLGLFLTLLVTTIIEVCSEGSTPIGADLVTRAQAPGNGFAFLMAGVATDYTEIMVIRQMTGSWKAAFFLPLVSVPQVLIMGWMMNNL